MILGNGIDIIEIKRLETALKRRPLLLLRIFSEKEREYFKQRLYNPSTIAGCFAAKEATVKAMGCGFVKDVRINYDESGKPLITVKGKEHIRFFASISHSKEYAAASVIATRR
ncbi:MAG: holo-ACP synthase [Clostridiaceae bacterium]|jgi:holo-[acyl-carrier protein] synthase|nr:holo-ACP synthase [Clostridiaceae bacterium]